VVLIQGLLVRPFDKASVEKPTLREWQKPGSTLVKHLEPLGDVYAFTYAQSVEVDEIADQPSLRDGVRRLRELGYREVVLVGHSAGGLIARCLVEDYPNLGVTKVVQVCTPNAGSGWAKLQAVPRTQKPFLQSLTKEGRRQSLRERADLTIPDHVEFVCLVGTGMLKGDGVVSCRSQWTPDLQQQGIPAIPLSTDHLSVVRSAAGVEKIASLVATPQPRWSQAKVARVRQTLLEEGPVERLLHTRGGSP
jgi:pimeloyl-ACP methyl ester carboxylesterase